MALQRVFLRTVWWTIDCKLLVKLHCLCVVPFACWDFSELRSLTLLGCLIVFGYFDSFRMGRLYSWCISALMMRDLCSSGRLCAC